MIRQNRGRLVGIARAYTRNETDDLLQEMLLQIWRSLPHFKHKSSPDSWCYRVALNTAISWRRKRSNRERLLPSSEVDVEHVPRDDAQPDCDHVLESLLDSLNESNRSLLLMYLEDLSTDEMADVLGITPGAVRVRLHRLRTQVAQWIGERS